MQGEALAVDWGTIWTLFHWALLAALLAGLTCPLVGCHLLVRRTGFYGITLPQFAAAGVACGFAFLPTWIAHGGMAELDPALAVESPHLVMGYHLTWAGLFTFGGLLGLVLLGRAKGTETARVAASFALASAATILFALASPTGGEFVESMLSGEILGTTLHDLETIGAALLLVALCLWIFHHDLVLVSYDPETARVLGKSVRAFEGLLMILTGLTVSVGVLVVGPVVLFGLLVIPPLAARSVARSMGSYFAFAVALGLLAALGGIWASFRFDWPLGPALVVAAGVELPVCWGAGRLRPA